MEHLPSEPAPREPWGPRLNSRQRAVLAKLSGAAERWCFGDLKDRPGDVRLAVLLGYSRDPLVWGVILGGALAEVELGRSSYERLAEVARAAGADEEAAQMHLAWRRVQVWR